MTSSNKAKAPSDLRIAEHALGTLSDAEQTAWEQAIADDPALANRAGEWHDRLAGLAHLTAPADPPADLFDRIEAQISETTEAPTIVKQAVDEGQWCAVCHGVSRKILAQSGNGTWRSSMLRFDAGAVLASHPHKDLEECVVVEGEIFIGEDHLTAGDYQICQPGSIHPAISSPKGALVFVRHGPL